MTKTLKNLIESYQKGKLNTTNIQVIDRIFSDEIIKFTDDVLVDLTFNRAFFEKSRLTKIRFYNGSFDLSFFKDCFLENCVFLNVYFQEMKSLKCIFKDCLFIDCIFAQSDISETIFESCMFSEGSLDDSEFQSCHFINTVFRDVTFGFGTLIDSKFSNSNKSIKFEGEVYFNDIFDQINKFHEVTFDIDVDGILSVKAREKETGVEQSVTIQGAANLNETEVEDMLAQAEKYATADKEKRANIDLKNQAEALCFEAEKEFNRVKDSLAEDKQENITKLIQTIRDDSQSDNFDSLKSKIDELKTVMTEMMSSKMDNESTSDPMSNLNDL